MAKKNETPSIEQIKEAAPLDVQGFDNEFVQNIVLHSPRISRPALPVPDITENPQDYFAVDQTPGLEHNLRLSGRSANPITLMQTALKNGDISRAEYLRQQLDIKAPNYAIPSDADLNEIYANMRPKGVVSAKDFADWKSSVVERQQRKAVMQKQQAEIKARREAHAKFNAEFEKVLKDEE